MIWGAVHGAVLIIERAGLARILETLPRAFQHAYALVVVLFAWVYFRAESLAQGNDFSGALLGLGAGSDSTARFSMLLTPDVVAAIIAGTVLSGPVFPWLRRRWAATVARVPGPAGAVPAVLETSFFGGLLLVSLAFVAAGTYNPFIYFRF